MERLKQQKEVIPIEQRWTEQMEAELRNLKEGTLKKDEGVMKHKKLGAAEMEELKKQVRSLKNDTLYVEYM